MSVLGWMTAIGLLLLFMALSSAQVQRLPISTSFIYLIVGIVIGPAGFGLLRLDLVAQREWIELLTQIALIVSLFVGGLKLRLPLSHPSWRTALRLAGPVMLLSIAGVALLAAWLLDLPFALALLVGAALAPTDPVLAGAVSVNDAEDHDRVRFALSGEAGLNDGMAFPFVLVALEAMRPHAAGDPWLAWWALSTLLWAVPAGLFVGYVLGLRVGRFAIQLRSRQRDTAAPSDFLALALIVLAFVLAERLHCFGFLAAFAAGVGLRHAELRIVRESPLPRAMRRRMADWLGTRASLPAEALLSAPVDAETIEQPAVAAGVVISQTLTFGDTVERLLEVLLVVMVGIMLADVWVPKAALLAVVLMVVIRPLAALVSLRGTRTSRAQRALLGWFGIRGIGSLYYVAYALGHGVGSGGATLIGIVITVVACSIAVHGMSVTPILAKYERSLARVTPPAPEQPQPRMAR